MIRNDAHSGIQSFLAIAAVCFVAYLPSLSGGFVWDDAQYVVRNPLLLNVEGLFRIWFEPTASPQYYPVTFTTFWIERRIWDLHPAGYRLVNLGLHILNASLVFCFLRGYGFRWAFWASLLWAIHPVRVESVAWITERKDVLSTALALGALLAWRRSLVDSWDRWMTASLLLFLAGLLSKTAICPLPVVMAMCACWEEGRISPPRLFRLAPFLLAAILVGLGHVLLERTNIDVAAESVYLSPAERFLAAGRAIWFYLGKSVWPLPLVPIYPRWSVNSGEVIQWMFPVSAGIGLVLLFAGRRRFGSGPFLILAGFVVMLAPALGFIPKGYDRLSYVADHFQYLASIGPMLLLTAVVAEGLNRLRLREGVRRIVLPAIALVLVSMTWRQSALWKDSVLLFSHNVAVVPDSWGARTALGGALLSERARPDLALLEFEKAVQVEPGFAQGHYNLGVTLTALNRPREAEKAYRTAIRIVPDYAEAHNNLGILLAGEGRREEAGLHFGEAARIKPGNLQFRENLEKIQRPSTGS